MKAHFLRSLLLGFSLATSAFCAEEKPIRQLVILLPDGGSLVEGAAVQYRGIQIGKVASVFLHETKLAAKIVLNDDAPELTDSDGFRLDAVSLLGDRVLTVVPGEKPGHPLENGSIVRGKGPESPVKSLEGIELPKDSEALLRLVSELTSIPDEERETVIDKCRELIKRHKEAKEKAQQGEAGHPPKP